MVVAITRCHAGDAVGWALAGECDRGTTVGGGTVAAARDAPGFGDVRAPGITPVPVVTGRARPPDRGTCPMPVLGSTLNVQVRP
jgi:hypothetical protein